ncbi:cell wall hydrolase [Mesorhizobium sp. NBSH29]|uniref:cell wall hydrolase n=1 Tax=Mesorhizobium sp. NBSH29 TaxID=2654249 RepID=UPI0018964429|nr:cell wall hydrolase [Mesorhizobium sp. NBSH29]QPC86576.1 cell wall hydrolase [Mesorhizobium sp. NBSH29]
MRRFLVSARSKILFCVAVLPLAISGCNQSTGSKFTEALSLHAAPTSAYSYSSKDKECLARAMFFESNRSSRDGLVAVGSVVMNRVESGKWGGSVCDVVGAKKQFAPGVLSRPMNSKALPDVMAAADSVLKGERHPKVKKEAMFFHTAGLTFPYKNMHYVLVAGGNAFYEKRSRRRTIENIAPEQTSTMIASAAPTPRIASDRAATGDAAEIPVMVATAQTAAAAPARARFAETSLRPTIPATLASSDPVGTDATLGYEASPQEASAIGALLLAQDRPVE